MGLESGKEIITRIKSSLSAIEWIFFFFSFVDIIGLVRHTLRFQKFNFTPLLVDNLTAGQRV